MDYSRSFLSDSYRVSIGDFSWRSFSDLSRSFFGISPGDPLTITPGVPQRMPTGVPSGNPSVISSQISPKIPSVIMQEFLQEFLQILTNDFLLWRFLDRFILESQSRSSLKKSPGITGILTGISSMILLEDHGGINHGVPSNSFPGGCMDVSRINIRNFSRRFPVGGNNQGYP